MAQSKSRNSMSASANGSGYPPGIKAILTKLEEIEAAIDLLSERLQPPADRSFVVGVAESAPEAPPERPLSERFLAELEKASPEAVNVRDLMAATGSPRSSIGQVAGALWQAGTIEKLDVIVGGTAMKAYRLIRPTRQQPRSN